MFSVTMFEQGTVYSIVLLVENRLHVHVVVLSQCVHSDVMIYRSTCY